MVRLSKYPPGSREGNFTANVNLFLCSGPASAPRSCITGHINTQSLSRDVDEEFRDSIPSAGTHGVIE